MTRNNNIIENFVDQQIKNIPIVIEKRYTSKYIIILVEFTPKGNTRGLRILYDQIEMYYNKKIKNLWDMSDEYKSGDIKKLRSFYSISLFCLKKEYQDFQTKLKIYIDKLCDDYFNYMKKNPHLKIHLTIDKINPKKFKSLEGDWGGRDDYVLTYNPNGLWYSCGDSFHKYMFNVWKNDQKIYEIFQWAPINIYSLDLKNLKVYKISNCDKFYKFGQKYENPDLEKTYIDWQKVREKLDGVEICPFITPECSGLKKQRREIEGLGNLFYRKKLTKKQKSVLWSYNWETASGVILNNFDKLEYKKIKL